MARVNRWYLICAAASVCSAAKSTPRSLQYRAGGGNIFSRLQQQQQQQHPIEAAQNRKASRSNKKSASGMSTGPFIPASTSMPSPAPPSPELGFCSLEDPSTLGLVNLLMRTNVTDVDYFLNARGQALADLVQFVALVRDRIPAQFPVSDREILAAMMVNNALGPSSRAIGRAIAAALLQRSPLLVRNYVSFLRSTEDLLYGAYQVFIGILQDVTIGTVVDIIADEVDWASWFLLVGSVILELTALVVTAGGYSQAAFALRFASAGFQFASLLNDIASVDEACEDDDAPAPVSPPTRGPGYQSGVFGDPHISTFDRLRFDCQAEGIFTMLTSVQTPGFEIQEQFTSVGSNICSQASVSTGIALHDVGLPTLQLSIPRHSNNTTGTNMLPNICPIDFFYDGTLRSLGEGTGDPRVELLPSNNDIQIVYLDSRVEASVSVRTSPSFGCFLLVQIFVPLDYRNDEALVGLLGTPNGVRSDDWVDRAGNVIMPPQTPEQSIFGTAYNYCVQYWCIDKENNSIFTFRTDDSFAAGNGCHRDYANDVELAIASASPQLQILCQDNLFCYVDGLCGNLDDALMTLQEEALVQTSQEAALPLPSTQPSVSAAPSTTPTRTKSSSPTVLPSIPASSLSPSRPPSMPPSAVQASSKKTSRSKMSSSQKFSEGREQMI